MAPTSRGPGRAFSQSSPDLTTLRSLNLDGERGGDENEKRKLPPSTRPQHPSPLTTASPPEDASPAPDAAAEDEPCSSTETDASSDESADLQARNDTPTSYFSKQFRSRASQAARLHMSASQLFPPFYNRPPTPLPPSPSFTSLLRPSFSAHTSHHTTPESSDVESQLGASSAAATVEKSARAAGGDVPRASPKVPTYEYYGFALYLASSAAFLMYILWAYLPSPFLHQLGIYYYPNRWWALAVPAWLVVCVLYIYVALASYNTGHLTLPMQSIENLVDGTGQIAVVDKDGKIVRPKKGSRFQVARSGGGKHSRQNSAKIVGTELLEKHIDWNQMWAEGTNAVLDVPIGGVNQILYTRR